MVVFVAVFLSQIRYAVSYCYCNLPPLYMLLRQDTINTIYVFRQWVDGRVISHFTFLLTLFSLYSLEWQLWGICDKNMQSRALLAQKYLTRRKTGSRIPKILFLIFLQKANIIALFTWGLTKQPKPHSKRASPCYHFPFRQRQWLSTVTSPLVWSPDTLGCL